MALFDVPLWCESDSPSATGFFMLAGTKARTTGSSTITTTPTPVPATPAPKSGIVFAGLMGIVAALAIAAVSHSRGRKDN
jgi:hypothetical protein